MTDENEMDVRPFLNVPDPRDDFAAILSNLDPDIEGNGEQVLLTFVNQKSEVFLGRLLSAESVETGNPFPFPQAYYTLRLTIYNPELVDDFYASILELEAGTGRDSGDDEAETE